MCEDGTYLNGNSTVGVSNLKWCKRDRIYRNHVSKRRFWILGGVSAFYFGFFEIQQCYWNMGIVKYFFFFFFFYFGWKSERP